MGSTRAQSVGNASATGEALFGVEEALVFDSGHPQDSEMLAELFEESGAKQFSIGFGEFRELLLKIGISQNFGQDVGAESSARQRRDYLRSLKLSDLALARACAMGNERAWERFMELYHAPLTRAAIAICGSDTTGRELADALYAELYGLGERDGQRRSPLDSYQGRGSLMGWMRTTLAQRHVDGYRRSSRDQPLSEMNEMPQAETAPQPLEQELAVLGRAVARALECRNAEERFLLASYYLDEKTLLQIARVTQVHEATVSRKLRRLTEALRKQVLRNLLDAGLSKRAAQEALTVDPRDLVLNFRKLLQSSETQPFSERAGR